MESSKEEYLVDAKGRPRAIVLSLKEYRKMVRLIQDIRDAEYIRRHRYNKLIPMDLIHQNLKNKNLV